MTSDKLIKLYEDTMSKKAAPHTMHNLPLEFAQILLTDLGDINPDKTVNIKQANNIWNFVIGELKAKGYNPYTLKIDGFKELIKTHRNETTNNKFHHS